MKPPRKMIDELEAYLFSACRAQEEEVVPGDGWRESVMSEIRGRGVIAAEGDDQVFVGRLAWRMAAGAGVIAVILFIYLFSNGVVNYEDLAMRFLENPIDFII